LSVKAEIDREIKAEELKEILRKQAESNPLEQIIETDGRLAGKDSGGKSAAHRQQTPPPGRDAAGDPP
jgi:sec-independent protein translocase protein TatB